MSDFNFSFPVDQLAKAIVEKLQTRYLPSEEKRIEIPSEKYLTRMQVGELLQISLPTVDSWTEKGTLKAYRIEFTKRYKKSEIDAALVKVNFGIKNNV